MTDQNAFVPTHEIIHNGRCILVQEVDRVLYTQQEWELGSSADWEFSDDGTLLFQGQIPLGESEIKPFTPPRRSPRRSFPKRVERVISIEVNADRRFAVGDHVTTPAHTGGEGSRQLAIPGVVIAEQRGVHTIAYPHLGQISVVHNSQFITFVSHGGSKSAAEALRGVASKLGG